MATSVSVNMTIIKGQILSLQPLDLRTVENTPELTSKTAFDSYKSHELESLNDTNKFFGRNPITNTR